MRGEATAPPGLEKRLEALRKKFAPEKPDRRKISRSGMLENALEALYHDHRQILKNIESLYYQNQQALKNQITILRQLGQLLPYSRTIAHECECGETPEAEAPDEKPPLVQTGPGGEFTKKIGPDDLV